MHSCAFQAPIRTKMHALGLSPPYFDLKKTLFKIIGFIITKYDGERLRHAFLYVLGPETQEKACLRSYPTLFWFKKKQFTN